MAGGVHDEAYVHGFAIGLLGLLHWGPWWALVVGEAIGGLVGFLVGRWVVECW